MTEPMTSCLGATVPRARTLRVVVQSGGTTLAHVIRAEDVDGLIGHLTRHDRLRGKSLLEEHVDIRLSLGGILLREGSGPNDHTMAAAMGLWLAVYHPEHGDAMRDGIVEQLVESDAVLTCGTTPVTGGLRDTAWVFAVGDEVHDLRKRLSAMHPLEVELMERPSAPET